MTLQGTGAPGTQTADGSTEAPILPPARPGYSMRPAMVVVGLAVVILAIFITMAIVTTTTAPTTDTSQSSHSVAGTPLRAIPADRVLSAIVVSGEPPTNIINSVSIPTGTVLVSHQMNGAAADQYDAQIGLRSDDSQGALETFFKKDMVHQGWQIFDVGAADHNPGATEVLGKKAGDDGFFWEMGAVVSATTFGPGAPATGETSFIIRLFQVPDPD
jgi:hypothetical protein